MAIVLIMAASAIIAYIILSSAINRQFNEKLMNERDQVLYEINQFEDLQKTLYLNIGDKISVDSVASDLDIQASMKDTLLYDTFAQRELNFRMLQFTESVKGQNYLITIQKSLLSTERLLEAVGEILLIITLALMIALIAINRSLSQYIWQPFNDTLSKLRNFDISKPIGLSFKKTKIDEFKTLNKVLSEMIEKSQNDFKNLKEFGENTSHEIQTPLAIIKSKAEILLQDQSLPENQVKEITTIYNAARRLSRYNKDLLLLAKINNHQFIDKINVNLNDFMNKLLDEYAELVNYKALVVETTFRSEATIQINETLGSILFINILNNAIKHNIRGGLIRLIIQQNELIVENTGKPQETDLSMFFERFKRVSNSEESSGIGLHIVKRICDLFGIRISYVYQNGLHRITMSF